MHSVLSESLKEMLAGVLCACVLVSVCVCVCVCVCS